MTSRGFVLCFCCLLMIAGGKSQPPKKISVASTESETTSTSPTTATPDTTPAPRIASSEIAVIMQDSYRSWCDAPDNGVSPYGRFIYRIARVLSIRSNEVGIIKVCSSNGRECDLDNSNCLPQALPKRRAESQKLRWGGSMWVVFTIPADTYEEFVEWVVNESSEARDMGIELVELDPINTDKHPTTCPPSIPGDDDAVAKCQAGFKCSLRADINANVPRCRATVPGILEAYLWVAYLFVGLVITMAAFTLTRRRKYLASLWRRRDDAGMQLQEDLLDSEDRDAPRRRNVRSAAGVGRDNKREEDLVQGLLDSLDLSLFRYRQMGPKPAAKSESKSDEDKATTPARSTPSHSTVATPNRPRSIVSGSEATTTGAVFSDALHRFSGKLAEGAGFLGGDTSQQQGPGSQRSDTAVSSESRAQRNTFCVPPSLGSSQNVLTDENGAEASAQTPRGQASSDKDEIQRERSV